MHQPTSVFPVLLLTLSLACQQCSSDTDSGQTSGYQEPPATHFTTLDVDSILVFPFEQGLGFYGSGFLFSPIEKNKIWLLPEHRDGGFELDLKTGKRTPFYEKFGHAFFKKPLRASYVHPDPYVPTSCWFLHPQEGAFHYDRNTGKGRFFDIAQQSRITSAILFTPQNIWIGTSKGLWVYDRLNGTCGPVQGSPEVEVYALSEDAQGRIWIGHQFAYDPGSYCWQGLSKYRGIPTNEIEKIRENDGFALISKKSDMRLYTLLPDDQIKQTADYRYVQTPSGGQQGTPLRNFLHGNQLFAEPPFFWALVSSEIWRLNAHTGEMKFFNLGNLVRSKFSANAPGEIWEISNDYWLSFHKTNGNYQLYRAPVQGRLYSVQADTDNLYVLTDGRFLIISKKYLAQNYAADPALPEKRVWVDWLIDSLTVYPPDEWPMHLEKTRYLKRQFEDLRDPYILSRLERFANSFRGPKDEAGLRRFLQYDDLDSIAVNQVYCSLISTFVHQGALRDALRLTLEINALRNDLPDFLTYASTPKLPELLKTTVERLDSVNRQVQPAYEHLWAEGVILEDFAQNCHWFTSEASCTNQILADSIFRKLVQQFPESPRADNAAYHLLANSICNEGEDGRDLPEQVELWQAFVHKYPESELRPHALGNIAWALGNTEADLRKSMRLLAEAERLNPELFKLDADGQSRMWLAGVKSSLQEELDRIELDFSITLKKNPCRRGEPVELVFTIRNTSKETKVLQRVLDPALPNFSVEVRPAQDLVNCVRPLDYVESKVYAYPKDAGLVGKFELPPGEVYRETWDLAKAVRRERTAYLGRYIFNQPGTYQIYASSPIIREKYSNTINLKIE